MQETAARESFGSRAGFIFAAAASAIGLGNFWRFPYLVNEYGGGTFILIYLISALTFGMVLVTLEVAVGRMTGKSVIEAYGDLIGKYKWIGVITVILPLVLLGYYCVIGGWVMKYAVVFITGNIEPFSSLEGSSAYYDAFVAGGSSDIWNGPVIWFIIFLLISTVVLIAGMKKGIELISKILIPILIMMLIVLIVFILMIPGIGPGIEKTFVPTLDGLSIDSVVAAMGQVFFSVSLGAGILIAYGSYLGKDINIKKTMCITTVMECVVAIGCAMLIVPMVFAFAGDVDVQGSGLMFKTLPAMFYRMPAFGCAAGAVFFITVFFAAWTSSVSLSESVIAPLRDSLKISRVKGVAFTIVFGGIIGMLCCLSYGLLSDVAIGGRCILDFVDFVSSNILMPISSIILCIIIGYVIGTKRVLNEIGVDAKSGYAKYFNVMIRYVCPVILIVILLGQI